MRASGAFLLPLLVASTAAARPKSALYVASNSGYPFVVHAPSGKRAAAEAVRDVVDWAWQREIIELGWPAPLPDAAGPDARFDIYLDATLAEDEAYVEPDDGSAATSSCFLAVPVVFASDAARTSILAHELNHASQFAMNAHENDAFFEHTAVFVEQRIANDVATYGIGIADYQTHPERGLFYLVDDYYEYGAALWLLFLSDWLDGGGHALVQRLWQQGPTSLAALDAILAERNLSRGAFFATFASWRWFTGARDDGHHFSVGADWGTESLVDAPLLVVPATILATLGPFGARVATIESPPSTLAITVDDAEGAVAVVGLDASGAALGEPQIVEGLGVQTVTLPVGSVAALVALTWAPPATTNGEDFALTRTIGATFGAATAPDPAESDRDGGPRDGGLADVGAAADIGAADEPSAHDETGCHVGARGTDRSTTLLWLATLFALARMSAGRTQRQRSGLDQRGT